MPSNRSRILNTFIGYAVLILIPLAVVIIHGVTSLQNHKSQIERNVSNRLRRIGGDFSRDFQREWQRFRDEEKLRPFYHYQPLIVPDEDSFVGSRDSVQRSPLFKTVDKLRNLRPDDLASVETQVTSPSLENVLDSTLIGYFQFSPFQQKMYSPYLDPGGTFETSSSMALVIEQYHQFLNETLMTELVKQTGLDQEYMRGAKPIKLLQRQKTKRVTTGEISVEHLIKFPERYGELLNDNDSIRVSYHDMRWFTFTRTDELYLVGFRPIMLGRNEMILFQGMIFNLNRCIQESQNYLESFQPEFGNIVVGRSKNLSEMDPLLYPFTELSLQYNMNPSDGHLDGYEEEQRRFWFSMSVLLLTVIGSLFHLGRLLYGKVLLDRKKNDFISAITHELKAPLTSIIMYAEMLEEGWVKGKEATYYRHIHGESERLSRLIKNILDYSGIERGVFKLKRNSLLLHEFIEETLEPLRLWIENNELELDLHFNAHPYVVADKDSLSQVLYNLIDNTIKYGKNPDGASKLTIILDEEDSMATLTVYDNGVGVPKSEESKVFNRFYRIENEMTRESTGTGLGLALVKELIAGNDGDAELFPPERGGFGVKISLPKVVIDPSLVSRPANPPI